MQVTFDIGGPHHEQTLLRTHSERNWISTPLRWIAWTPLGVRAKAALPMVRCEVILREKVSPPQRRLDVSFTPTCMWRPNPLFPNPGRSLWKPAKIHRNMIYCQCSPGLAIGSFILPHFNGPPTSMLKGVIIPLWSRVWWCTRYVRNQPTPTDEILLDVLISLLRRHIFM